MKVHLEMTRQVGANALTAIFGTTLAPASLVFLLLVDAVPDPLFYTWIALQTLLLVARFYYSHAFIRFDSESKEWERAVIHFNRAMFF